MSVLPLLALVCSALTFEAPRVYEHDSSYHQPVVADFDGDGRKDLLVSNWIDAASIRYGEPGGKLSEPQTIPYPVGGAGDVVGDALPDLFTNARVVENLGGRAFALPNGVPANGRFFARDFTGDGRNDLVIASMPNRLHVLERLPNGRLEAMPGSDTGAYTPWSAAGDVDGDRRTEIIGLNANSVRVFRYAGAGRFEVAATHTTSEKPRLIETADLDGDGRDDILVGLQMANAQLEVFYGNGTKASFNIGRSFAEGDRLRVAHINNDGAIDVLVAIRGPYEDVITVYLNDGHGALRQTTQLAVTSIYELGTGDVTGDGKTDLILPSTLGVAILNGHGNGRFFEPPLLSVPSVNMQHAALDLDDDGVDEIAFHDGYRIGVLRGDGTVEKLDHLFASGLSSLRAARKEVFAQDGRTTIAFAYRDGAWHKRTLELENYGLVHAADFDGDGSNELVAMLISGAGYSVRVHHGDGKTASFSTYVPAPMLHDNFSFLLDDLTGDGVPDLALALTGTRQYPQVGGIPLRNGSITIYAGSKDGTFTRIATPVTDQSPRELASGDFNGDGVRDLAFTTYDNDARVIYAQAGNFTAAQIVIAGPSSNVRLAARDLDGDGITDLLGARIDAFVLLRGTREGLIESGRWTAGRIIGFPLLARLHAHEAPALLLSTSRGAAKIDTTCVQSRRRSVRH